MQSILTGYISLYSSKDEQVADEDVTPNYSMCAASHIRNPCLDM